VSTQKIGRYEVVRELGHGGMATVYLAHDPAFERQVALKVISHQFADDPGQLTQFRARFQREAKVIAALEHSCIVPVYDYGEDAEAGQPFIVMRYMTGGTLADRITGRPMPLADVVPIIQRLAGALQAAHQKNILHRDVKPGNVLFDSEGQAHLSDFGTAKQIQGGALSTSTVGTVTGTFAYMSPEQAQGGKVLDGRSDIYSLGVVLYEMLTGLRPYQADTPVEMAFKHVLDPIPPLNAAQLGLPVEYDAILTRTLAKRPEDRYPTVGAFAEAVSGAATMPIRAASPTSPHSVAPSLPTQPGAGSAGVAPATRPFVSLRVMLIVSGIAAVMLIGAVVLLNALGGSKVTPTPIFTITSPIPLIAPSVTLAPTAAAPALSTEAPSPTYTHSPVLTATNTAPPAPPTATATVTARPTRRPLTPTPSPTDTAPPPSDTPTSSSPVSEPPPTAARTLAAP